MTVKYLLTNGNRELKADGIFTWSLPALAAKLSTGKNMLVCPSAGVCAQLCYARSGTYNFSNVKAAHVRNLELILDDSMGWKTRVSEELKAKRYQENKSIRIHDSGDFFSEEYFLLWVDIAKENPHVFFYAYTKEVAMVKRHQLPDNFVIIFSMGGTQDHLVDKENDRHADVFPSMDALIEAGYTDQEESDLLAATLPTNKIGIVVNNIPHLKKKQGQETFATLQAALA
jgi:Gene product 88